MLYSLRIENIAIIEQAEITLCPGLNVLTGETGAGKSIIIDSLNAALGRRTSRELIRTGAESAAVTAEFQRVGPAVCDELLRQGIPCEDGTAILSRQLYADGRNHCRINGTAVTVAMLKGVGDKLVNIHGQHDSQALLAPEKHCGFVDALAENEAVRKEYKESFARLIAVKRELDALYTDEDEKAAKLDYLDFQIKELENAALQVGEREKLTARKNLCLNAQKVQKGYQAAYAALAGGDEAGGAVDAVTMCAQALNIAVPFDKEARAAAEQAKSLCFAMEELAANVRRLSDNFEYDPAELGEIEERLDTIFRITRKYGGDEAAALENLAAMQKERNAITLSDERAGELERQLSALSDEVKAAAARLTQSRWEAASRFEARVGQELRFLDMPNVRFEVSIKEAPFSSKGADAVEFMISPNPGEELKPIAKIASGGELSRIMLAIKNVISAKDDIDTLIFDEIDSGVSGRAAQKIAMKLQEVSVGRQVICVTHLAQIGARGDRHLKISKSVEQGKTFTEVTALSFEERKAELARIMGGLEVTASQLQSAEELLLAAGIKKE